MGLAPGNPIVGGTILRIPAIQSPNFSMVNKTGWAIFQNGDAVFFGITLDGGSLIVSGSGQGVFLYSGTPARGDLYLSITSADGVDDFENDYVKGVVAYDGSGNPFIQLRPDLSAILMYGT